MLDLFFDLLALLFVLMVSVLGVFKTSLMLEELKMLRSYCTHSYGVLQQKNTDQNQITEKAHGQGPGEARHRLPGFLSQ